MENFLTIIFKIEEIVNLILCSALIFNMKMTNKIWRYLIAVGAAAVITSVNCFSRINLIGMELDFIFGILISIIISKEKKLKSIVIEWNSIALVSLMTLVPYYTILLFSNINRNDADIIFEVIANTIVILVFICYIIYFRIKRKKREVLEMNTKQYFVLSFGLWSILLMAGCAQIFEEKEDIYISLVNLSILAIAITGLAFIMITLWLTKSISRNANYKYEKDIMINQMKTQEQYVDMIVRQNDIVRKFRHDVRGHMIILQKHIEDKEYDLAEDYIKGITNLVTNIATDIYTGVAVVDAVIADICSEMENKNITLNWKGRIKGCEEKVTEYELCIIFMNIMKNAIEACENVEKNRNINVNVEYIDGEIHISENNPILGQLKMDEEGILQSQKDDKENHGIGSRNVREIVEKYNGEIEYQVENGRFNVVIVI